MTNKFIPNSFQVPNVIVDELIADMKEAELKCFLLVIRKTTGWQKEMDAISVSQFMVALKLSKQSVISGCDRLIEKGLLVKTKGFRNTNVFSLDWSKILTSQENRRVKNLDTTSQNFRQDHVKNLDTQNNTIQNINNNPPIPPLSDPSPAEQESKREHDTQKFDPENVVLPNYVDRDVWIAYCRMRKAKGKGAMIQTEKTVELCLKNLEKFSGKDPEKATAVLEQSIANTWTGLFALKVEFNKSSGAVNAHDKSGAWAVGRTITIKRGVAK
ncbi:replication protein [Pasteurella canis]|uniref:replication protein n=1 Tax=Pasteurella canis TaxID=753 RepID=UPI0013295B31|nr:replication protein [Pasteurella canis]MXN88574.1 hypothetical protein [Pasteurella canis]